MDTSTSKQSNTDQSMLNTFFLNGLKDTYGAEKQLTKALPELQNAATSPDLKAAFEDHLKVTENQIQRLERVFEMIGQQPQEKKCEGMEGLIKEGQTIMQETESGTSTRDAALIVSAQKVEHYEIAAYGSLRQLAKTMGKPEISELLEQTLEEEKATDLLLSNLAEMLINEQAKEEM